MAQPRSHADIDAEKTVDDRSVQSVESFASHDETDVERGPQYMDVFVEDEVEGGRDVTSQPKDKGTSKASRVLSRISTRGSWIDPGPPPDGGLHAWLQVACGHMVIICTWGLINSFGVFQTYYVTALDRPPSDIAWIGSFQVFLTFFIGTFTGRLTDAGYFRSVFLTGTFLSVFGIMMASLGTTFYQIFLAQGVCVGLGNGCLFCPMLSLVSTYFSKKRSLALGISACGSATGGLVFPAMVQNLLPRAGFGWTMRALGFLVMACLIVCNILARQRVPPRRSGPIIEWSAFKEPSYTLFAAGMFFNFWGVYFAFFYIGSFARTVVGLPYSQSINLILVLNGLGFLGRLLPNYLADRYTGPINQMVPVTFATATIMYTMIAVDSSTGLYVWACFYGTLGAAIQSLFPAVLSSLTTDLRKAGVRMGMIFTIVSFAVLTGPPIEGALISADDSKYVGAQLFAATSMAVAGCLLAAARISRTGWKLSVKM